VNKVLTVALGLLSCIQASSVLAAEQAAAAERGREFREYELPHAPGDELTDEQLERRVRRALAADSLVDAQKITVESGSGTIRLSGSQRLLIARERATYLAETVSGVRHVINEIDVRPDRSVGSGELEAEIRTALKADPATPAGEVRVQVDAAGRVVLSGVVNSDAQRHLTEQLVKSVAGVTSVSTQLQTQRIARRSDQDILTDVRRMLQWDADVAQRKLDVKVQDGVVTLSGAVHNAAEKRRAVGLSWVAGVKHVDVTPLAVSNGAGRTLTQARRSGGAPLEMKSDAQLAAAINNELQADDRLAKSSIEVKVQDGVVTLQGEASDEHAKRVAQQIPYGLLGVAKVKDEVRVRK
jgi:osmotically-inducible protein OsmY